MLRYLSDAYRAIRQTVPDHARTEELEDIIEWLGALVRQVDSSLVDEWEALAAGRDASGEAEALPPAPPSLVGNTRAFTVLVRNEMFRRVQLAALERDDELEKLDPDARLAGGPGRLLRGARRHAHGRSGAFTRAVPHRRIRARCLAGRAGDR